MAKKAFLGLPYPPLVRLDRDVPVSVADLLALHSERPGGFSVCVRSASGHENRGGYFFHIVPSASAAGQYYLVDFERIIVTDSLRREITFTIEELAEFVNHCSGLSFSERYLLLSQTDLNFRLDPDEDAA